MAPTVSYRQGLLQATARDRALLPKVNCAGLCCPRRPHLQAWGCTGAFACSQRLSCLELR